MTQENDPWGKEPRNTKNSDIEAIFSQIKKIFGGSGGSQNSNKASSGDSSDTPSPKLIMGVVGFLLLGWAATGLYIVEEGFNGVETLLGKHSETTESGWRYHIPYPVGNVTKVDVGSVKTITVGTTDKSSQEEGQMLTSDENIVEVGLSVLYRIKNPENYLFKVNNPELVLKETLVSSIREVVGGNGVDYILTNGRGEWPAKVKENLIATLEVFEVGIEVEQVLLKEAKAPSEVQDAFDDAVKAREDAEKYKIQAEAYKNNQIPKARGQAKVITEAAEGYKQEVISKATGEADRFNNILTSYKKAPKVTRDRMYLETMSELYSNSKNILLDTDKNAPMLYMPINSNGTNIPPVKRKTVTSNINSQKPATYQPMYKVERIEPKVQERRKVR